MSVFSNFLSSKTKNEEQKNSEPQIGFKIKYDNSSNDVVVKILGAKQLPTTYGNNKPQGYLVKVTLFPQRDKFETRIVEESWPTFDEEYKFKIRSHSKLDGLFISFTAYAILYSEHNIRSSSDNFFERIFSFTGRNKSRQSSFRRNVRHSLNNRRTIGSVTYNLEMKNFNIRIEDKKFSTPEIWRELKEVSSGVIQNQKENKKGTVEATMLYSVGELTNTDIIEISVSKLRCNIQTMEEHERFGGKLYLKISAFEMDDVIQKIKSDKFDPTISLKLEKSSAKLKIKVDEYTCNRLKILIKLMCKPLLGQKLELGRIEIDRKSDIWDEMLKNPMTPITKIINLE